MTKYKPCYFIITLFYDFSKRLSVSILTTKIVGNKNQITYNKIIRDAMNECMHYCLRI